MTKTQHQQRFLLLCTDALIALVLLAGLTDVDELMVALGCRFALDVSTKEMKQEGCRDLEAR